MRLTSCRQTCASPLTRWLSLDWRLVIYCTQFNMWCSDAMQCSAVSLLWCSCLVLPIHMHSTSTVSSFIYLPPSNFNHFPFPPPSLSFFPPPPLPSLLSPLPASPYIHLPTLPSTFSPTFPTFHTFHPLYPTSPLLFAMNNTMTSTSFSLTQP